MPEREQGRHGPVDVVAVDEAPPATVVVPGVRADLTDRAQQRHGEPAAGVDVAGEHVDETAGSLVAREPRHHERGGVRHDLGERVRPPADHDDDGGDARRRGRLDEGQLVGGQPEVARVAELAGRVLLRHAAPAADEDDRDVGAVHVVHDLEALRQRLARRRHPAERSRRRSVGATTSSTTWSAPMWMERPG